MVLLIVDDDAAMRTSLGHLFSDAHEIFLCVDGVEALKKLQEVKVDIVITDFQMPNLSGLDLIKKGKEVSPSTSFVLMTAFGSVNQAVEAIRLGADDYLMKPFDLPEIEFKVARLEEIHSLRVDKAIRREALSSSFGIVGKSTAVAEVKTFISKVAAVLSPILILGQSGTGKEVVARAIHDASQRANGPFIPINCASLNEQLMESELFGHEKGAFTGAIAAKLGKFELANNGTIFLDEIGELSAAIQARLLRVLQEKEFFRLGGVRNIRCNARVIAATHRPLKQMVQDEKFREDLYFRLNVVSIELPPLSERRDDIPLLAEFFWKRLGKEMGRKATLSPEAMKQLLSYSYPGNIRELQNVLERMMVLSGDLPSVGPELLPSEFRAGAVAITSPSGAGTLRLPPVEGRSLRNLQMEFERAVISEVMRLTKNNQTETAARLGISRGALQYKMRKCGYEEDSTAGPPTKLKRAA